MAHAGLQGGVNNWPIKGSRVFRHRIAIPGLGPLQVGNGGSGGLSNEVDFTAGINNQADGLIDVLAPVPAPTSAVQAGLPVVNG